MCLWRAGQIVCIRVSGPMGVFLCALPSHFGLSDVTFFLFLCFHDERPVFPHFSWNAAQISSNSLQHLSYRNNEVTSRCISVVDSFFILHKHLIHLYLTYSILFQYNLFLLRFSALSTSPPDHLWLVTNRFGEVQCWTKSSWVQFACWDISLGFKSFVTVVWPKIYFLST
jgi:hypothetical protein